MILLQAEDITAAYGRLEVLRGVSLSVDRGETLVVLGPNGAGKTTLLKAITGIVRLRRGTVHWRGHVVSRLGRGARARSGIAYVPDSEVVFPTLDVLENLKVGLDAVGKASAGAALDGVFALFPVLKARLHQQAGTLSGGERRMLAIGRALAAQPALLVLDEPSAGLAVGAQRDLAARLRLLCDSGLAMLIAEQNLQFASLLKGAAILIDRGLQIWAGPVSSILSSSEVEEAIIGRGVRGLSLVPDRPDADG